MSSENSITKQENSFIEKSPDAPQNIEVGDLHHEEDRVVVTPEDDARIRRKTDIHVLTLLCLVYFLQILDKSVIGYSAVFGLKTNAHLVGDQYNTVSTMGYYAQLGAQPLASYLMVKLKVKIFMPVIVFCWGVSLCGMAASDDYSSLLATRFLLGWFEAACLPLFSLITVTWYRRSEQPLRVAAWYGMNGVATMIGSALAFGLGHIQSAKLYSYQIIFLVTGLITVATAPLLLWKLNNSVETANFLSPEDRLKAVERLRTNNQGAQSYTFKWRQALELAYEPKSWLFMLLSFLSNTGTSVSNVFGPLILKGLLQFDDFKTTLLNIPFGAVQFIVTMAASWCAWRISTKGYILAAFMVPVVIGSVLMYTLPRIHKNEGPLLLGYYFLAFNFAANPLIISWMAANTGGQSKKAAIYCAYNAFASVGNIVGPQLFKSKDAPNYIPGLEGVIAIFCIFIFLCFVLCFVLTILNRLKAKERVRNGKPANIHDLSMVHKYDNHEVFDETQEDGQEGHVRLGENGNLDMTDRQNDEFIYVL